MTALPGPPVRACLRALRPYRSGSSAEEVARKHAPPRISKLSSNENPLGPGPRALEAIGNLASLSVYPDPSCRALRVALASATGKTPENVFVANGSDEVLLLIAAAYLDRGQNVLVGAHTFFNYEFVSRIFDGEVRELPARELATDLPAFSASADRHTRLVFLCNPNNPTGQSLTHAGLAAFLSTLPRETLVVIDEAYCDYADAPDSPDTLDLMEEFPNLVIVRTFSKAHGLAALRVGYAIAHPTIVEDLLRVRMPYSVNLVAQLAAVAALEDAEHLRRTVRLNAAERSYLFTALEQRGCRVLPSQANFLCFAPPAPAGPLCEQLARQGVLVRHLRSFSLEDWIRVTVGTPEQNAHFLEALGDR